ncbi:arylamine N-acetyltransferase [Streptomyces sp. NPDC001339]|uniref:arylamine N-acetyltransferase family protein n=1 Tax=Streptomyces sp. NPDC001339 TaxID=3364563 RepID=UPI0036BBE50A
MNDIPHTPLTPHTLHADPAYGWSGDELDLDAYLDRIGYEGDRAPTLEALRGLQRAHVTSIPFENLDPLLGVPIALHVDAVQDKLVRERRGGYCYEHVTLFAAALERLGFEFTGVHGRVTEGAGRLRPATHAMLAVTAADDDRLWLSDVGFGRGPLAPIPVIHGAELSVEGWDFTMERRSSALGSHEWWLHERGPQGWQDRYSFTLNPQYPIDYAVGSHFVSTHAKSPFIQRPYIQRFSATHHHVLDGTAWTTLRPDGSRTERTIEAGELHGVLTEIFGIPVSPQAVAGVAELLEST